MLLINIRDSNWKCTLLFLANDKKELKLEWRKKNKPTTTLAGSCLNTCLTTGAIPSRINNKCPLYVIKAYAPWLNESQYLIRYTYTMYTRLPDNSKQENTSTALGWCLGGRLILMSCHAFTSSSTFMPNSTGTGGYVYNMSEWHLVVVIRLLKDYWSYLMNWTSFRKCCHAITTQCPRYFNEALNVSFQRHHRPKRPIDNDRTRPSLYKKAM